MKRISILLLASFFIFISTEAQVKSKALKKVSTLKMPGTAEDDMPGKRGACVVWHPKQKKYYAVMAGNAGFPVAVFDATGKILSGKEDNALIDARGLWYNADNNRIEGNGYNDNGWFYYKLNENGMIVDFEVLFEDMNQPNEQSVGAYNFKDKTVLFLKGAHIYSYDITDATETDDELILHWGRTEKEGASEDEEPLEDPEGYNTSTVIYTNLPGTEIGVLNITKMQVELYNKKNGFMTQVLRLPENATVEGTFNFAYTNGMVWLFDMDGRTWSGYK